MIEASERQQKQVKHRLRADAHNGFYTIHKPLDYVNIDDDSIGIRAQQAIFANTSRQLLASSAMCVNCTVSTEHIHHECDECVCEAIGENVAHYCIERLNLFIEFVYI